VWEGFKSSLGYFSIDMFIMELLIDYGFAEQSPGVLIELIKTNQIVNN